jgi:hypothetical protein
MAEEALFLQLMFWWPVSNQMSVAEQVYFWVFYSIPLIPMSVFVLVPCCFVTMALQYSLKSGTDYLMLIDWCSSPKLHFRECVFVE